MVDTTLQSNSGHLRMRMNWSVLWCFENTTDKFDELFVMRLRNTIHSLACFVKHCKLPVYIRYFSSVIQYLIQLLVKLTCKAPMQYSKFDNVIRNNQSIYENLQETHFIHLLYFVKQCSNYEFIYSVLYSSVYFCT